MISSPSFRRSAAFSLIELMIVIVIIAVLTTIGLPAFQSTMKRAEWSKVQSQMKTIITAFHTYSSDHDGYMPPAYYPNGSVKGCWLDTTIFPYVYPESGYSKKDAEGNDIAYDAEKGEHLRDTVFMVKASVDANPTDDDYYNHSFLVNRSLVAEATATEPAYAPRKATLFTDWSSIMLLTEGPKGDHNSIALDDLTQLDDGMKRYDGKLVHFGFLDGHVEQIHPKDVELMKAVVKGQKVDSATDGWHTAWFGFSPDRMPSSTPKKVKY